MSTSLNGNWAAQDAIVEEFRHLRQLQQETLAVCMDLRRMLAFLVDAKSSGTVEIEAAALDEAPEVDITPLPPFDREAGVIRLRVR